MREDFCDGGVWFIGRMAQVCGVCGARGARHTLSEALAFRTDRGREERVAIEEWVVADLRLAGALQPVRWVPNPC